MKPSMAESGTQATRSGWQRYLPAVAISTFGSLATAMAGQGALVVSGIISARMLGPENRGHLALLVLVPFVVCQVGLLGMGNAVTYYIAQDRRATAAIVRTAIVLAFVQIVLCSAVNAFVIWLIVRDESRAVQLAGLATLTVPPALLMRYYGLAVLQGVHRFRAFNTLRLVPPFLYAAGLVLLLVFNMISLPVVAVVSAATTVAPAVLAALTAARAVPAAEPGAAVPTRSDLVRFGAKGFLGAASPLETFRLDQAVVGLFLSPGALGIYVASLAFTNLPRFIAQSIGMVAFPHIAAQPDERRARRSMWRFFWLTLGSSVAVVFAIGTAAPRLIPLAFGEEFRDAVVPMQILLVGSVVFGARRILAEGMRGRGYPAANTVAEIASWIWLVPALALLVPLLELKGAAIAIVGSSVVSLGVLGVFTAGAGSASETTSQRAVANRFGLRDRLADPGAARRFQRAVLMGIILVGAAAAGWAMVIVSEVVLVLAGGLVGLGSLLLGRRYVLSWLHKLDATAPAETSSINASDGRSTLALPRLLYYAGAASIAVLAIRPTSVATISDWFFLASLLSAIGVLLLSGKLSFSGLPRGLVIGIVIFASGAYVSSLQSASVLASIAVLARFVYLTIGWFWLGTVVLETPKHVRTAIACWIASAALSGAASVAQLRLGDVIPGTSPEWGRMTGLTQHVNDLGASSAIALVPAVMMPSVLASRFGKLAGALVILPLVVAGLLLSGSVGALTAGSAGLLFWLAMGRLSAKAILAGVAVGLGILLLLSLQREAGSPSPLERFQSTTDAANEFCTACSRFENSSAAWEAISYSPLIGAGMTGITGTGHPVHNMILGAWFEAGLLGVLGIVAILISVSLAGISAVRGARSYGEWAVCLALLASFLSFVVIGMVQPILFQRYSWIGAGLLLASWRQQAVQRADAGARVVPRGASQPIQERQRHWVPQPVTFLGGPR